MRGLRLVTGVVTGTGVLGVTLFMLTFLVLLVVGSVRELL
jgi:hypothetical protein